MASAELREASYSDLAEVSHVLAVAFRDNNIFGDIIHPLRHAYPEDTYLWFLRQSRVAFWDYRWRWLVALDRKPSGEEIIVGCAQWHRKGKGGRSMDLWWFDPRQFQYFFFQRVRCSVPVFFHQPLLPHPWIFWQMTQVQALIVDSRTTSQTAVSRSHEGACTDLAKSSMRPRHGRSV